MKFKSGRVSFQKLTKKGNFVYKRQVLASVLGAVKPVRRKAEGNTVEFVPCENCFGFFEKR